MLKEAGIVQDAPTGRHRVYSIDVHRLEKYRRRLDTLWAEALNDLAATPHQHEREIG